MERLLIVAWNAVRDALKAEMPSSALKTATRSGLVTGIPSQSPPPAKASASGGASFRIFASSLSPSFFGPARSGVVEIALTNGRSLKVDKGIDPALLARIVNVLDKRA